MSVRRLAKHQPASFAFTPESMEKVNFWLGKYPPAKKQSASIPLLWLVQKQEGWVCEPAIRLVAQMLETPVIRILEVATFYTMFQLEPVGSRALIQVCGTTPCGLRGANELLAICKAEIGEQHHISADGVFTWEEVECMGACCNAPMAAINDYYFEDLTPDSFRQIIADFRAGKTPQPGSYAGRHSSEPAGGAQTLSDPALYDGSKAKKIEKLPNAPEPQPEPRRVTWRQPYSGRIILALVFAVAFLINGGLGLWVNLATPHPAVNGLSAVVFVFGLASLVTAIVQFIHMLRPGLGKNA